ncbi:GntR family transcriptional regulator [Lacipirellula parvula]|uniref:HTH gntR-type domain-containing protein n=1 Tax=Lacipirellula parvula TaxID=2650471 RepID=A0A5K7XAP6_9BACT|nr:GntR family transcriptional regulator [Lacipirellula parvula]BBO33618.1 hypothetical protein PLANPX_3230 [Lacipirellula parvula]
MSTAVPPKFELIKRQIIADIESGALSPGDRIASETELMEQHGVARMTVVRSLNDMVNEGYVVRVKGKGTFVKVHPGSGDAQRKLSAFALLVPEMRSGFYPSLIKSFSDAAAELSHQTMTCNTANSVERQGNAILQLIDNRVAGVALVPNTHGAPPDYHVRQLQKNGIPVVLLHRDVPGVSAPLIHLNHEQAGFMAGEKLVETGHCRVAFFGTHASIVSDAYAEGLRRALRQAGCELPSELIHYGQRDRELDISADHQAGLDAALERMFKLPVEQRPTAIFSTWAPDAELIYLSISRLGLRIPSDVSLLSIDGVYRSSAISRQLTGIAADEEQAGKLAAQLLEEMSNGYRPFDDQFRASVPLGFYPGATLERPPSR